MFTIKFYAHMGCWVRIYSAESFTVLKDFKTGEAEITLHQKNPSDDFRIDIKHASAPPSELPWPAFYQKAIIENAAGKTTEIIMAPEAPTLC